MTVISLSFSFLKLQKCTCRSFSYTEDKLRKTLVMCLDRRFPEKEGRDSKFTVFSFSFLFCTFILLFLSLLFCSRKAHTCLAFIQVTGIFLKSSIQFGSLTHQVHTSLGDVYIWHVWLNSLTIRNTGNSELNKNDIYKNRSCNL